MGTAVAWLLLPIGMTAPYGRVFILLTTFLWKISQFLNVGSEATRFIVHEATQSLELRLEAETTRIHVGGDWRLLGCDYQGGMALWRGGSGTHPTGHLSLQDGPHRRGGRPTGQGREGPS